MYVMISIENFYWILYQNLLKPCELNAFYYYPFGTFDNLLHNEFGWTQSKKEHHVLFQFDQEPIYHIDDVYANFFRSLIPSTWRVDSTNKIVRILANSEKSQIKKDLCKHRGMIDWYFFYHGIAALDWFRDSQYVGEVEEISRKFFCPNHLVKHKRSYRMALVARLMEYGIVGHGDVSFFGTADDCRKEIDDPETQLSDRDKILIEQNLCHHPGLPLIVDSNNVDGSFSARFGHRDYKLWQRSFLHVVGETIFYDPKLHLTEKIFKPIVSMRPFVLVSSPGNLAYLREYGFKTFSPWIDESYDTVHDNSQRLDMIAKEILKISSMSIADLKQMHQEMKSTLEYNKQHFFNEFRRIVVDELVENFDGSIRVWNNGRVDGRELPRHPDLDSVKKLLLQ